MQVADKPLQENVLVLACFSDEYAKSVFLNVTQDMFDNEIYQEIFTKAKEFYSKYNKTVSEHLPDVFEKQINNDKSKRQSEMYKTIILSINELREDINPNYVMSELNKFIKMQTTRLTLKKAVESFQKGDLDEVDKILESRRSSVINTFDPGLMFAKDFNRTLSFLSAGDELFSSGVEEMDNLGIAPARQELFVNVGLPNAGKSMGLIHIGKVNLMCREKVLHVSLEMSEDKCSMRYVQSLLSIAKNSKEMHNVKLSLDDKGKVSDMSLEQIVKYKTLKDSSIESYITNKLKGLKRPGLIIKNFPTAMLTIDMLRAYLDNLISYTNFHPSILIVDYADLMSLDAKNLRVETGQIYQKLRGIGVEYDIAVVTASQANRTAEDVVTITRKHLAEDFSKVAIADNLITYNQTPYEYRLGLARLYVDKARNDRKGDSILITQNYNMAQYCIQSALLKSNYFDFLDEKFSKTVGANTYNPSQSRKKLSYAIKKG